jgi:hypothetical protein
MSDVDREVDGRHAAYAELALDQIALGKRGPKAIGGRQAL